MHARTYVHAIVIGGTTPRRKLNRIARAGDYRWRCRLP